MDLKSIIRDVVDFPKPGIVFKDITPLLNNPQALKKTVDLLSGAAEGLEITKVAGIESRGFIFGAAAAIELNVGFVPIRKPGKLPAETISESYSLEYGTDTIEMHKDALESGDKVLLIDDLLATGGSATPGEGRYGWKWDLLRGGWRNSSSRLWMRPGRRGWPPRAPRSGLPRLISCGVRKKWRWWRCNGCISNE